MKLFKSGISILFLLVFVFVQLVPGDYSAGAASKRTQALSPFLEAGAQTSGTSGLIAPSDSNLAVAPGSQYSRIDILSNTNSSNDKTSRFIKTLRVITMSILSAVGLFTTAKILGSWSEIVLAVQNGKELVFSSIETVKNNLGDPGTIADVFANGILILLVVFSAVVVNIKDFLARLARDVRAFWKEKIVISEYDKRLVIGYFSRALIISAMLCFAIPSIPTLWSLYMGLGAQLANFLVNSEGVFPEIALIITGLQQFAAAMFGLRVVKDVLRFLFPKVIGDKERGEKDFAIELVNRRVAMKVIGRYVASIVLLSAVVIALIFGGKYIPAFLATIKVGATVANMSVLLGGILLGLITLIFINNTPYIVGEKYVKDMMKNPVVNIYTYRRPGDPAPKKDEEPRVPEESLSVSELKTKLERFFSFSMGADMAPGDVASALSGKIAANSDATEADVYAELKALAQDAQLFIENNMFNRKIRSSDTELLQGLMLSMLIVQWNNTPGVFGSELKESLSNATRALADAYLNPVITGTDTAYGFDKKGEFLKLISSKVRAKINGPLFLAALYHRLLEHNLSSFVPESVDRKHLDGRQSFERLQVFSFLDSLPIRPSYAKAEIDKLFGTGAYETSVIEASANFEAYFSVDMGALDSMKYSRFMKFFDAVSKAA